MSTITVELSHEQYMLFAESEKQIAKLKGIIASYKRRNDHLSGRVSDLKAWADRQIEARAKECARLERNIRIMNRGCNSNFTKLCEAEAYINVLKARLGKRRWYQFVKLEETK